MAAPVVNRKIREAGGFMYAIVAKEFFDSCTFQNRCGALNVQVVRVLHVRSRAGFPVRFSRLESPFLEEVNPEEREIIGILPPTNRTDGPVGARADLRLQSVPPLHGGVQAGTAMEQSRAVSRRGARLSQLGRARQCDHIEN